MIRFPLFLLAALWLSPVTVAAQTPLAPASAPMPASDRVSEPAPEAAPPAPPPVLLELFTSQGCAFCPPADELLGQMAQQRGIIALACHVDYFAVRGPSLGKEFCSRRQNDYNRLIGTGPRYTPQLVINGHMDLIGYEAGKISASILKARGDRLTPLALEELGEGAYRLNLPATAFEDEGAVKLWMAVYDAPKEISITDGANLGKRITYVNVVSRLQDLGPWDGSENARAISGLYTPDNAGLAIFAQNTHTGRIIAAGSAER